MKKYFDIPIEFDRQTVESTIEEHSLNSKGYCCFVDSYVLVKSKQRENGLLAVLENSTVNACDGSYIAIFASRLYNEHFRAYNGPEFFSKYIYHPDRQCVIGNTEEVFNKVVARVKQSGQSTDNLMHIALPFAKVDEYDYEAIARQLNAFKPRYTWVSLGAPKQELFMSRMLPLLDSGMMLGVGAALNYFSGEIRKIPGWAEKMHLIWFYRIITEPVKQFRRSFFILRNYAEIYLAERRKLKRSKR